MKSTAEDFYEETDSFSKIEKLDKGWFDGQEGERVPLVCIKNGRRLRDMMREAGVGCSVFPTIEGGVSIEDSETSDDTFTITLFPDGSASIMVFNDDEDQEGENDEEHPNAELLPGCSPWMTALLRNKNR